MRVYAGLRMLARCGGESMNAATMLAGDWELFIPTFSAAVCPPHRLRIGLSDWCESRPWAAIWGDHGSANLSGQACAVNGGRPAAARSALTRFRTPSS
jgi:hypothetical protein